MESEGEMNQEPEKLAKYLGPKPWQDCTDAEKIERLRDELDGWRRECARLRSRLTLMEQHQHGATGAVLVDLQQADHAARQEYGCASINTL
jgi:hypothetical protein